AIDFVVRVAQVPVFKFWRSERFAERYPMFVSENIFVGDSAVDVQQHVSGLERTRDIRRDGPRLACTATSHGVESSIVLDVWLYKADAEPRVLGVVEGRRTVAEHRFSDSHANDGRRGRLAVVLYRDHNLRRLRAADGNGASIVQFSQRDPGALINLLG